MIQPNLPQDTMLHPEDNEVTILNMKPAQNEAEKKEFLIGLLCLGAPAREPHILTAVHTLVSSAMIPLSVLASFLLYLTDY